MSVGVPLFARVIAQTLTARHGSYARPTRKRVLVMSLFLPFFLLLQLVHRIGFLLDEIFFRGYRAVPVREPLFVVGNPRSGTTLLQHTIASDSENFTAMKLWEIVFAPSVVERKFWRAVARLDGLVGGLGRRLLGATEDRLFGGVRHIHPISFFQVEEDDFLLFYLCATIFLIFPFPFQQDLWHLAFFDSQTPPEDRRRIMSFYRSCVQRHLYVHGPEKQFFSKNMAFSPKIDAIRETFPDARIACCVRTPYEAVPSLLSFMSHPWRWFDNLSEDFSFRDELLDLMEYWYRRPMERLRDWPASQHSIVRYEELTADPEKTVTELYARLGYKIDLPFAERLAERARMARGYRSRHRYALSDWGLTSEYVLERFRDVFENYGFPTDPPRSVAEEPEGGTSATIGAVKP